MTDLREKLEGLAERCEAATGPDRELDAEIGRSVGASPKRKNIHKRGHYIDGQPVLSRIKDVYPPYTASLDAAMSLVPEGADYRISRVQVREGVRAIVWGERNAGYDADAATPALALTAACLRARAIASSGDSR